MRVAAGWFALVLTSVSSSAAQQLPRDACAADTGKAAESIRLYLSPIRIDSGYRLTPYSYSGATHVEQNLIDFSTRADSTRVVAMVGVATRKLNTWNAVQFAS